MLTLPPDLIVDVLSHLPVKSLCRFKCVSKSWLVLITYPQFVKLHMAQTRRQKFLLFNGPSLYHVDPKTSLMQEPSSYRKVVPIKHDHPFKEEHHHRDFRFCAWVSDSCNGLFCILMLDPPGHDFFIYNPSTRESKKIPNIESDQGSYNMVSTLHGFGYAESIDDYKFVKVVIKKKKIIQIFSLRNNSWKTIKCDFPFNVNKRPRARWVYGIPLNGALHWVVDVVDYNLELEHHLIDDDYFEHHSLVQIVAFDFAREKFKTLPILNQLQLQQLDRFTLLGDYLCLINRLHEFWIMEEYGVKQSWTRISIPKKPHVGRCSWRDAGFLFLTSDDDGCLFGYEKDDKYTVFDGIRCYSTQVYMENLVSPDFHTDTVTSSKGELGFWFG